MEGHAGDHPPQMARSVSTLCVMFTIVIHQSIQTHKWKNECAMCSNDLIPSRDLLEQAIYIYINIYQFLGIQI